MTPEQRQKLSEKLTANAQRHVAAEYLLALPPDVRGELSQARVVVRPESDSIEQLHLFDSGGIGRNCEMRPIGFIFKAFSDVEDLLVAVEAFGGLFDTATGLFHPSGFRTRSSDSWYRCWHTPTFEVNFGWARRRWVELYATARQACGLTMLGGEAGILTRVVCGYLDRPADDRVYEVAYWGNKPT